MRRNINKNGFTLIEVLAVIVVLAIIATLVFTSVGTTMSKSKEKLHNQQIETLENAARNWILKNSGIVDNVFVTLEDGSIECSSTASTSGECFTLDSQGYYKLTFTELNKSGYIKTEDLKDPATGNEMAGCIGVYYDSSINQYVSEYQSSCLTDTE